MKKYSAFSLLESALAIFLIGILLSGLISYWQLTTYKNKLNITINRANYIRKSLQGYVMRYGFLPYASDHSGMQINGKVIGFLPYKILGINQIYSKDGFGRDFIYVVNENLVLNYNINNDKLILPIFFPLSLYPTFKCVSFCRLYDWQIKKEGNWVSIDVNSKEYMKQGKFAPEKIASYDKYDATKNIKFNIAQKYLKKAKIKEFFLQSRLWFSTYVANLSKKHEKNEDIIAWALISRKNNKKSIKLEINENDGLIFWQSRKNLAAQIDYPCTCESLDVEENFKFYNIAY